MNLASRNTLTILGLACLVLAGTAAAEKRAPAPPPPSSEYRIGPDDVLDIVVWNNEEVSRRVPVRPDGKISLPLLDDVHAAGLTATQLAEALADRLSRYIDTPEVSVIVAEIHSFKVSVIGQVRTAGQYEMSRGATVLDAIARAGGFTDYAKPARMMIIRNGGGRTHKIRFDFNQYVDRARTQTPLYLETGDVVVVP
jgi:polysaccharide export outer membrane protein